MAIVIIGLSAVAGTLIALWMILKHNGNIDINLNILKGQLNIKKKKQ